MTVESIITVNGALAKRFCFSIQELVQLAYGERGVT